MLQGERFNGITKEKTVVEILFEKGCICHRGVLLFFQLQGLLLFGRQNQN